jgi:hypothetical protein
VDSPSAIDVKENDITAFEAARESSYDLHIDGIVSSCGRNDFGQLGHGRDDDKFLVTVEMPTEDRVIRLLGTGPNSHSRRKVWGT